MADWMIGQRGGSYTDRLTAEAEARAAGTYGDRSAAIFEAIASSHERAFSQGRLAGGDERMRAAVQPALLACIGRALIERGEFVADVARMGERWLIRPAESWEIVGGKQSDDPEDWTYRLHCAAPAAQIVRERPRRLVAHVITRASPQAPHYGRGLWPLTQNTGDAVGASEARLKEELSAVTGQFLAVPGATDTNKQKEAEGKIKRLKGGVRVVKQRFPLDGRGGLQNLQQVRVGANPPEQLSVLRGQSAELLALAGGIPGSMVRGGRGSEQRESLRVLLFMTILPLAGLVSAELSRVFRADVQLEFSRLTAADLGGRARAAKQLTDAGVDLERALSLAGFSE